MKKKKRKKIISIDTSLWLFTNIKKTFKYYFKNIFYIFFLNLISFIIIEKFIKIQYGIFILKISPTPIIFKVLYYSIFIILFYTIKAVLYGNTVYVMSTKGSNDIKDLLSVLFKRYFPTLGTIIVYMVTVFFFGVPLVLPGILFSFYYYFGIFLCCVGDINNIDKDKNAPKLLNGGKALGRSYTLVKNNLIRFMTLTVIIAFITYVINRFIITVLIKFGFILNNLTYNFIRCCIYDLFVIYSAVIFIKFQRIENDVIEEEFKNNQEEQALLNEAAINNFGKSKK